MVGEAAMRPDADTAVNATYANSLFPMQVKTESLDAQTIDLPKYQQLPAFEMTS